MVSKPHAVDATQAAAKLDAGLYESCWAIWTEALIVCSVSTMAVTAVVLTSAELQAADAKSLLAIHVEQLLAVVVKSLLVHLAAASKLPAILVVATAAAVDASTAAAC